MLCVIPIAASALTVSSTHLLHPQLVPRKICLLDQEQSAIKQGAQSLSLQVSNPALLLNHMAERYSSTSRILMEFVDNGLDDAEALFDSETGSYQREVTIDVFVSRASRTLRILDNCRGMSPDTLSRVVMRVGESRKRGASFVNGQFGFGMQAFRAACSTLTVRSSSSTMTTTTTTTTHLSSSTAGSSGGAPKTSAFQIRVQREKDEFQLEPLPESAPEASALVGRTGTEVLLEGFDPQWVDESFSVGAIAREIESHFERLLARENLQIRVWDDDATGSATGAEVDPSAEASMMRQCQPVDYAALCPGASVNQEVELGGGQVAVCNLCVLPLASARRPRASAAAGTTTAEAAEGELPPMDGEASPARFFVGGRRIATCAATPSFARLSANRWTVWAHPQVVGFIDILGPRNGPLQPVITRDEFKNTRGRTEAYARLMEATEEPLLRAIEAANERVSERSLSKLEEKITAVLASVADDERKEAAERERLQKLELKRRRREAAAAAKAAAAEEAAALAEAEALRDAEAQKPFADKVAPVLGSFLETVVSKAVDALDPESAEARAAAAAAEAAAAAAEAAKEAAWVEKEEEERKRRERRMKKLAPAAEQFTVRLVRGLPGLLTPTEPQADGATAGGSELLEPPRERSRLVGSVILVDSLHPDFQARWRQTRQGAPKVDERLCGYLATVVSSHYRERAYQSAARQRVDYAQAYEEMISTYCKLENGLRQILPALLKEMGDEQSQREAE